MKTRKILSTLLAFALVFSLLPTAALAASAHTAHSGSCDHEGWTKLWMDGTVLMAGDTACSDNEDDYYLPDGSYWLEGDLTTDKTIVIEGEVDLCLNGHSIITSGSRDGIAVDLGGTLNLYDESGNSGVITHADGVIGSAVWCIGEFNMYGGTISGNNIPNGRLGIVYVNGKFTMAGGAITGNEAGSGIVDISGFGTFTMTGGTISGNKVFRDGGGVFVDYGCVFEMPGGTIENNTAGRNGSNVCIWNNGTFRLGGGTIADITYLADGTPSGSVYIYEGGIFEKLAAPIGVTATDAHIGEQTQITVNYPADADTSMTGIQGHPAGLITILIDGMEIDTLNGENGVLNYSINIDSSFSEGTHTIRAVFNGDGKYSSNSASTSFNVLPPVEYPLWVGGVQVTSANKGDITSAITAAGGAASGTASFAPDTNTLTLTDFQYSGAGYEFISRYHAALYYDGADDLVIRFSGENCVERTGSVTGYSSGLYFNWTSSADRPTVSFLGSDGDSLTVKGGVSTAESSYGIRTRLVTLAFSGGEVNAAAGDAYRFSCGVYADNAGFTVSDGHLNASGGTTTVFDSQGVNCEWGKIDVTGGALTAAGGGGNRDSFGIKGRCEVSVSGGMLIAQGDTQAMKMDTLSLGDGVTAQGSTDFAGENPVTYAAADNDSYKWVKAEKPATYTVTVTPGANMMIAAGADEQTVQAGNEMERVVYLASEGYYFPEDYAVASVNGVAVMRDSFTRITVFGTPTADASITLPDPTAKVKEPTPTATFTATGPDSGTLTGVTAGMTYAIDGGTAVEITAATVEMTGLAPCTITVVQPGNGTTTIDSEAQTISVTKAETPDSVAAVDCTTYANYNGKLTGVTAVMEYKESNAAAWISGTGDDVTGLVPGTYLVRAAAAGTLLASDTQKLTVAAYVAPPSDDDWTPALVTEVKSGATITSSELDRLIREGKTLTVEAEDGTKVELSNDALKDIAGQTSGSIRIDFTKETPAGTGGTGEADTKTAYDLTVSAGGKAVDFDGKVDVIPAGSAGSSVAPIRTAAITTPDGSRYFVVSREPFPYTDVPAGSYYYDAVNWADLLGITEGSAPDLFNPNGSCTRAQMVTFLWRAAGCPEPTATENTFTDLDESAYYYKAVLWAYENGITVGIGDGKFDPNGTVTRAQSVTFLCRALGGKAVSGVSFDDVDPQAYYAAAVAWAAENGITLGTGDGNFSPEDDCLRGQIVTFLYRAYHED